MNSQTARIGLLLAAFSPAWATPPQQPAGGKPDKAATEIRQVEDRRLEAMVQRDTAALDRILAEDVTYTHSSGRVETKAQFLAALQSGELKYESAVFDSWSVRVYGRAAVVTGQATMRVQSRGQQLRFQIRFTDVYVQRGGRWQMVAWQSTRLP